MSDYSQFTKINAAEGLFVGVIDSEVQVASAAGGLYQGGTLVTATAAELNTLAAASSYVKVTDAETYAILAANSGKPHIMPDLTADCVLSLPTAAAGLKYEFMYGGVAEDAHDWQFDTGADANFYLGGLTCLDPGDGDVLPVYPDGDSNSLVNVLTPGAGTKVELICDGTNWYLNGLVVTNTDAGVTFADQA